MINSNKKRFDLRKVRKIALKKIKEEKKNNKNLKLGVEGGATALEVEALPALIL